VVSRKLILAKTCSFIATPNLSSSENPVLPKLLTPIHQKPRWAQLNPLLYPNRAEFPSYAESSYWFTNHHLTKPLNWSILMLSRLPDFEINTL
jgi:hypothetical protein